MEDILDVYILNLLKDIGFNTCQTKALHLLKELFLQHMFIYCKSLKHITNHAGRHKTIMTDIFNQMHGNIKFEKRKNNKSRPTNTNKKIICNVDNESIKNDDIKNYKSASLNNENIHDFEYDDDYVNLESRIDGFENHFVNYESKDVNFDGQIHDSESETIDSERKDVESVGKILTFENEIYVQPIKFNNEIASKIDRYIHIYEFMPEFPPTHTFKRSFVKFAKKHENKIKERVEQNLVAEQSVFRMICAEQKMPKYVNFMDYMEK